MVDDDTVRDEDDFRKIGPTTKYVKKPHRLRGTNLTRYSMYSKFCADYRGYSNGNEALGYMVNSLVGNAYPFRVSNDRKQLRNIVKDWWSKELNNGPKERGNSWITKRLVYSIQGWQFFTRME